MSCSKVVDNAIHIDKFLNVRNQTTEICARLETEDQVIQPIAFVSPPKWHMGHTTWFFEEMILVPFLTQYTRFNQQYKPLFNSYYKSAGEHWLQQNRGQLSRPTVSEILRYRAHVDCALVKLLKNNNIDLAVYSLLEIGLHHEQQHQELLLMDIKYILGSNPIFPVYSDTQLIKAESVDDKWLSFTKGIYQVGCSEDQFSYDNEKPRHSTYIHPFKICENTVTNGEFLEFIKSKGYSSPKYWLSMGWDWVNEHNIGQPLYWRMVDNVWYEFTLHGLQKLDINAPVTHVSYFEADAYANWKKARLPTEQEFETYLTFTLKDTDVEQQNDISGDNVFQPYSADAKTGQVWCWTKSHYSSYPGYQPYQGVLAEYNGKFMCNQFVLKSGCIATPKGHYRHTYRNFYAPQQRWMFSGIRLVKDI